MSSDSEQPGDGSEVFEKIWAVAGLIIGGVMIYMAVDLLRGPKAPAADDEPARRDG